MNFGHRTIPFKLKIVYIDIGKGLRNQMKVGLLHRFNDSLTYRNGVSVHSLQFSVISAT